MVTMYTGDKKVHITYANGVIRRFDNIAGIGYRPGKLLIIWADYTMKQVDNPADIYKHISCLGRFDIDVE